MNMPDINGSLKRFNAWWDIFILEAIKPVAILSMGLGTVAIFNLQGLAINPVFVVSWAIVQAASIDGLFFATWDRLFSLSLKWSNALAIIGLMVIGLILALVAIAINAVLGFQVLWAIADSQNAMAKLGINPELFTAIRAVLAVVVFIFISYVRARARANEESQIVAISPQKAKAKKASIGPVVTVQEAKPLAIPEVAISHNDGLGLTTGPKKELVRVAIQKANETGEKLNLKAISQETGASYSYVKLVKKELGIE